MAMNIPLPKILPDIGSGGGILNALNSINTFSHNVLKRKYYAPDMESQINNRNALTKGQTIENEFMPEKLRLANQFSTLRNNNYEPNIQSEINSRNAITNKTNTMLPLESKELELKNKYYPDVTKADIDYKKMGGAGGPVGTKELWSLRNQLAEDHPDWEPQQIKDASNAYVLGSNVWPDGTPLPPLGGYARSYLNKVTKRDSTAQVITGGVKARQAEAELEVLNKYANEGMEPYGTTYLDKSPQQIMDTFRSDDASQKRLGRFIASQALQYEAAQNRVRLAQGQPGVSATEELMKLSKQLITSKYPRLTGTARKEATRYMDEALKKGLQARQSIGTGASAAMGGQEKVEQQRPHTSEKYNMPPGTFPMYKDGEQYFFPASKVNQKIVQGYKEGWLDE